MAGNADRRSQVRAANLKGDCIIMKVMERGRRYIYVYALTNWTETVIARIPNPFKNRERIYQLVDSLNLKYYGRCRFTTVDVFDPAG